jgi:hypothetical protein
LIVVNPSTRQFNIPGADLVFGVTADSGAVTKEFQCPRYVGNNLDLAGCFIRMNYRNANGEIDSYLVKNVAVDGDNIVFGWELSPKVTMYKGNVSFVMCVVGPDTKLKWHTTLGRGQVLEGLEPDSSLAEAETEDGIAALVAMVEAQTVAVADTGVEWVRNVQSEGTDQIVAVQTAGAEAKAAAVAEIEAKGVNTRNSIPADYTALSEAVDGLVRGRAGAIVCSAEGSAITVNDASDMAIQGMKIFGRSTQDGTPTPDAPVEIVSVDKPVVTVRGKNLLSPSLESKTVYGVTFTVNDDGSITVNGTATQGAYFWCYGTGTQATKQKPLPRGKYTVSGMTTTTNGFIIAAAVRASASADRVVLGYGDTEESASFTVTTDTALCDVLVSVSTGTTVDNVTIYPMLEVGDVATEYEAPIAPQTLSTTHTLLGIPVTSGGNYTDSDGQQWICDEVDLERGVYVRRVGYCVYDGSEDEEVYTYGNRDNTFEMKGNSDNYLPVSVSTDLSRFLSNRFVPTDSTSIYLRGVNGTIAASTSGRYVRVAVDECAGFTVEEFRNWLVEHPVTVYYELNKYKETPLSETEIAAYRALHSNYPNTTVLNDSGAHMVVKYAADTKCYIDNKIAALVGG